MFKSYILKIIPITNIHIGTGETLEPLNYFVKNNIFIRFSPFKIISNLSPDLKKSFSKLADLGNIKQIAEFLHENLTEDSIIYKTNVSDTIQNEFDEKFKTTQNQQIVLENYRNKFNYLPVIPGSSIKGAIRTAVLYYLMKDKNLNGKINVIQREISQINPRQKRDRFNKGLEAQRLILQYNDSRNDPFRVIQITDCEIRGKNKDSVVKVKNYHLKKRRFNEFVPSCEVIKGKLSNGDAYGECEMNIFSELFKIKKNISMKKGTWSPIKERLNINTIIKACRDFYKNNFSNDYKRLYDFRNNAIYQKLKDEFNILDKSEFIIRLGRYSQIENMTIVNQNTNSRMFDENNLPMGYAKIIIKEI